jgi:hypothetical protein
MIAIPGKLDSTGRVSPTEIDADDLHPVPGNVEPLAFDAGLREGEDATGTETWPPCC